MVFWLKKFWFLKDFDFFIFCINISFVYDFGEWVFIGEGYVRFYIFLFVINSDVE